MIKDIFNLTNKYIVIATPFIIYTLISTIYMDVSVSSRKPLVILFAIILSLFMTGAFIAGWGKMIKAAVTDSNSMDTNSLLKIFPEGVGEYFLPSTLAIVNVSLVVLICIGIACIAGNKFIGIPDISVQALSAALTTPENMKVFLSSLSMEQLAKIGLWNILFLGATTFAYFLMILYIPVLFFKSNNAYKALWIAIKDLFSRHFFKTLLLYVCIFAIYIVLSIFSSLCLKSNNIVISSLSTLSIFYFGSVFAVAVFYYYYHEFIESKLGRNIDVKI